MHSLGEEEEGGSAADMGARTRAACLQGRTPEDDRSVTLLAQDRTRRVTRVAEVLNMVTPLCRLCPDADVPHHFQEQNCYQKDKGGELALMRETLRMGRGFWRLNSSLLEEAEKRQSFEDFLQSQN
ncbi:uncharacterized protein LOC143809537 isoform X2 [Ranitomeya variabilis]|uniref:uncharacterized protein LOC143809537 isoform X2 n=1 Tax=Ranitomeya variabilis TaxID=490064 RepID=UPI004056EBE3